MTYHVTRRAHVTSPIQLRKTKCCLVPFALNVNNWFDSEYFFGLMMTSYLWVIFTSFENEPKKIFWLEFCLVNGSPWAFRSQKNQWPHVTFSWRLATSWVCPCKIMWLNMNQSKRFKARWKMLLAPYFWVRKCNIYQLAIQWEWR